jgi:YD repeat-containing protein
MRKVISAVALMLIAPLALAQTTRTYSYDALGRLIKVTPGAGTPVCYTHDAADNRTTVSATAGCTGGSSPPPPPPNSGPLAFDDMLTFESFLITTWSNNLGVLQNDTDPDLPYDTLTVTSVTGSPYATVAPGGSDVYFSGPVGSYVLTYTIKDAQNATATGLVYLTILYCNPECQLPP